jgi:hypothetical protein
MTLVKSEALVRAFSPGSTLEPGLKTCRRRGLKCLRAPIPCCPSWYYQLGLKGERPTAVLRQLFAPTFSPGWYSHPRLKPFSLVWEHQPGLKPLLTTADSPLSFYLSLRRFYPLHSVLSLIFFSLNHHLISSLILQEGSRRAAAQGGGRGLQAHGDSRRGPGA